MKEGLFFKKSKVNATDYMQIWKHNGKKGEFVRSCGSAKKLNADLVELDKLRKQTKDLEEFSTKILSSEKKEND